MPSLLDFDFQCGSLLVFGATHLSLHVCSGSAVAGWLRLAMGRFLSLARL